MAEGGGPAALVDSSRLTAPSTARSDVDDPLEVASNSSKGLWA